MSFSQARTAVHRFLDKQEPRVLAVRGDWGVGKTFLWREIIKERGAGYRLKKYAYVSLFGVESLRDLKQQIVQKTRAGKDAATPPTVESATHSMVEAFAKKKDAAGRMARNWRGGIRMANDVTRMIPILEKAGSLVENLLQLSLRDTLICLDDIERKGTGLRTEDVFGLISELKEEQGCSIVLLLNDDALRGDVERGYGDFRDKVVDIEVKLAPLSAECCDLVIPPHHSYRQHLTTYVEQLRVTNMRIIRRCADLLSDLEPLLSGREEAVIEETVKSIVFFCWCWFHRRDGVPTLESVIAAGSDPYVALFKERKDMTSEESKLRDVMRSYGHFENSAIDEPLAAYVRDGYCDESRFKQALDLRDADARRDRAGTSWRSVFERYYHGQFGDNETEFRDAIRLLIEEHGALLNGRELDQAVQFLRWLGRDKEAEDLIDRYIDVNSHRPEVFDTRAYSEFQELKDPYIIRRFKEVYVPAEDTRPVFDVALEIVKNDSWNQADIELLVCRTPEQYYELLKTTKTPELRRVCIWLLEHGTVQGASAEWVAIADNLRSALQRIRGESNIDRVRVDRLLGADEANPDGN